jgi:hypothetical protein
MKKRKYNPECVEDEVSISNTLSDELDIVSGDEMSECESETCVVCIAGWEDVTMGNKKLDAYTFTKNARPQFHLLPDAEPMDYFSLFFTDEF